MDTRRLLNKRSKSAAAVFGAAALAALLSAGCGGKKDNPASPKGYTLTINIEPAGSGATDLASGGVYDKGDSVAVTAIPAGGNVFIGWTGAAEGTANPATVVMDKNKTLTANFLERYTITASPDPAEGGIVDRAPDSAYYASNTAVALSALVNPGYKFTGWEGDTALAADKTSFICRVTRNSTFTAKFQRMPGVLIGTTGGGSVSVDPKKDYYEKDEKVVLTAEAEDGYVFARWLDGKGVPLNSNNPYIITIGDTDAKLTAEFEPSPQ